MLVDKNTIETLVGTKISNLDLYERAFTHKSALKEDETLSGSFETLEFIVSSPSSARRSNSCAPS
jgi:ribonuclease-3